MDQNDNLAHRDDEIDAFASYLEHLFADLDDALRDKGIITVRRHDALVRVRFRPDPGLTLPEITAVFDFAGSEVSAVIEMGIRHTVEISATEPHEAAERALAQFERMLAELA